MKKNMLKKSGLFFIPIITVIVLVLAMPVVAFSDENEGGSTLNDAEPSANLSETYTQSSAAESGDNTGETVGSEMFADETTISDSDNPAEPDSGETSDDETTAADGDNPSEPDSGETSDDETTADGDNPGEPGDGKTSDDETIAADSDNPGEPGDGEIPADEINGDNPEDQEIIVELIEEIPAEVEYPFENVTRPDYNAARYNPIYLSGLNIISNNWDFIIATVTNAKTGETQEGYLNYQSRGALFGYLTSGIYADTNNSYKIEARIYMLNGEVMSIYGSSTGTASSGARYSTISFKAEGNVTITTPEEVIPEKIDIPDPEVPLALLESSQSAGSKNNPLTYDRYIHIPVTILLAVLAVCLMWHRRLRKG